MKTKYLSIAVIISLTIFIIWSCEKEFVAPTGEPNHEYVTSSFGTLPIRLQVNDTMDFIDLSRGVVDRTWTFPEAITDVINSDNDRTAKENVIKAAFRQYGVFEVQLSQTYAGDVTVWDSTWSTNTYDTTLTVTVLDYVRAIFEARTVKEQTVLVNEDGAKNQVMAGREVVLVSRCTGEPADLVWTIEKDNGFQRILQGDSLTTVFSSLGLYDITLVASSEFGTDTVKYTDWVEAIPSTDPVELFGITSEEGKLFLEFSRDIANPATCPLEAFTLEVRNGINLYDINVSRISLDPVQNNILVLDLDADIYNSDKIKVSYDTVVGDLQSVDGMPVDEIIEQEVRFITPNLLEKSPYDYSFEVYDVTQWRSSFWGSPFSQSYLIPTDERAYEGNFSAKFVMPVDSGSATQLYTDETGTDVIQFPLTADVDYLLSAWVYLEYGGTVTNEDIPPDVRFYASIVDGGLGTELFMAKFNSEYETGTWVYSSIKYTPSETNDYFFVIRAHNTNNSEEISFFLDEISISELEVRPN